ncbi:MAG: 2-amino-4-hydroxy-6-hydroxymethyldihydropteridine diphosphokinase [Bacteriovorax sp.]|jgi:2-amino-4-hydroxy-6-hydroxymethyldihydropteridine diphosphokinase|nr:2-amino-4-hydroxy-6-hydroxymethyldihydropteridine diphosphokinase [Bacteriovorax sp.]
MTCLNSFFIATGANQGDRIHNLFTARDLLKQHFHFIAESRVYESPAVDYLNQPDFYNQVLEFQIPTSHSAEDVMLLLLSIEKEMGRNRLIPKGPRLIDLDLLFWGNLRFNNETLILPHPRLFERSFVVLPLSELPGFNGLKTEFEFRFEFNNSAIALS